tara:strand:- start:390 stop:2450 length:2061 start_codon:yes stop_codon:yes gene_type:complete
MVDEVAEEGRGEPSSGVAPESGVPAGRWWWLAPVAVMGAAAVSALPGLAERDMTGDEWGHLGQSVLQMLDRSIESNNPDQFSAHMPLAWLLRHAFHSLFGDQSIVVWRLHSALGCFLAGGVAWWALFRRGRPNLALIFGLIVAVNPILSFHAHDSTNYALGPFTGALLLVGLCDLREGRSSVRWTLPMALMLGMSNDYFFVFLVLSSLLLVPFLIRRAPDPAIAFRHALGALAVPALVFALPAALFARRLSEVPFSQMVYRHANAAERSMTAWETLSTGVTDFSLSYLNGYGSAVRHHFELWVNLGPLLLTLGALLFAARARDPMVRVAGALVTIAVAQILVVDYVFGQVVWDAAGEDGPTVRDFPNFPRTYIALMPALVLVWLASITSLGRRLGIVLAICLLLVQGTAMLRHVTSVSNTRAWAVERIEELWQPGDLVMSCLKVEHRLDPRIPLVSERRLCLPDTLAAPHRIWMVSFPGGWEADRVGLCWNQAHRLLENGYRVRLSEDRFLPPHDEGTNSFLQSGIRLIMMENSEAVGAEERPWVAEFHEPSFAGLSGSSVITTWFESQDSVDVSRPFAPRVDLGRSTGEHRDFSLIVHPAAPPRWLMDNSFGLFKPYREPIALWPQMPLPADPIDPILRLRTYAFAAPGLSVMVRALGAMLGLAALLSVLLPRRRRVTGSAGGLT